MLNTDTIHITPEILKLIARIDEFMLSLEYSTQFKKARALI